MKKLFIMSYAFYFLVEIGHDLIDEGLKFCHGVDIRGMVELSVPWWVLHAFSSIIDEILGGVVSKYHAVIFGPEHVITGEGSTLFELLAIRKDEFNVVPITELGFL